LLEVRRSMLKVECSRGRVMEMAVFHSDLFTGHEPALRTRRRRSPVAPGS